MKSNSQTNPKQNAEDQVLSESWRDWLDNNLDRGVFENVILEKMVEDGKFTLEISQKYLADALDVHRFYAEFIAAIKPDFNDPQQNELNMNLLRDFLDEERKFSAPGKIIKRLETQWLELDPCCKDFAVRERKIAFFHAFDYLILAYKYDFPYPDPERFRFFPKINSLRIVGNADDMEALESQGFNRNEIFPIFKINGEILYFFKDKNDRNVLLGKGTHGKVYHAFHRHRQVAVKLNFLAKIELGLKWQKILVYYRQSQVVFGRSYENVLPMQEIFFCYEKSIFTKKDRFGMMAVYPICKESFYDRCVKVGVVFVDHASLLPMKKILQALVNLHRDDVCMHDFVAQNIMFDFDGEVFLHDFDYWLPRKMHNLQAAYTQSNVIGSGYCSLSELDFLIDCDVQKIVPDKIDVWCFGMILLVGLGYIREVEELRMHSIAALQNSKKKYRENIDNFASEIQEIKRLTVDFVEFRLEKFSEEIASETDASRKKFLEEFYQVLQGCLAFDLQQRCSAEQLLKLPLFHTAL